MTAHRNATSPNLDVAAFAAAARQMARGLRSGGSSGWVPQYQRGLIAAHAQGDLAGLADMALFAAIRLDTEGQHLEAIAQTEFALSFVGGSASSVALLGSIRAFYEALAGNAAAAREALAVAEAVLSKARPQRVRLESAVACAVTRAILLDDDAPERLRRLVTRVQRTDFDWQLSGLLSWLVPQLVARGNPVGASPWLQALAALAATSGHAWRESDATIFRLAIEQRDGHVEAVPSADAGANYIAAWRGALLRLHHALRDGNAPAALQARATLDRLDQIHDGFRDGAAVLDHLLDVHATAGQLVALAPPESTTLLNAGLVLAGTEYVAVHGDQASATAWMARLTRLPREIRTTLEWPVARDRVEGLLRIRTGDARGGIASLRAAVQWCDAVGYVLEGALSRIQLGEVLALAERPTAEGRWRQLRTAGIEVLTAHGIDPVPGAYEATQAVAAGRGATRALLAPREVQVIKLLADGMTYREASEALGVRWRTVQTHAYHAYAKLGVNRRLAAVEAARERGII